MEDRPYTFGDLEPSRAQANLLGEGLIGPTLDGQIIIALSIRA